MGKELVQNFVGISAIKVIGIDHGKGFLYGFIGNIKPRGLYPRVFVVQD